MIRLTGLEVYHSIFNITEENNKFKLYMFSDSKSGGVSHEKVRDEIERDFVISDNRATDLQDDKLGPVVIADYREHVTKRLKNDEKMDILAIYNRSSFQDFERFLRTESDLVEDGIKLVLGEYKSIFITYEL